LFVVVVVVLLLLLLYRNEMKGVSGWWRSLHFALSEL
jgi:hypothetical protein